MLCNTETNVGRATSAVQKSICRMHSTSQAAAADEILEEVEEESRLLFFVCLHKRKIEERPTTLVVTLCIACASWHKRALNVPRRRRCLCLRRRLPQKFCRHFYYVFIIMTVN